VFGKWQIFGIVSYRICQVSASLALISPLSAWDNFSARWGLIEMVYLANWINN